MNSANYGKMDYFHNKSLWPVDRSGNSIFLIEALFQAARKKYGSKCAFPQSLCPPEEGLPDLGKASPEDLSRAAFFVEWHDPTRGVSEQSFPPDENTRGGWTYEYVFENDEWNEIVSRIDAIRCYATNIDLLNEICIPIIDHFANGNIESYSQNKDTLEQSIIIKHNWNINNYVIKARFALGQFDPNKPASMSPRGPFNIFINRAQFDRWLNGPRKKLGDGKKRAETFIRDLAAQNPYNNPPAYPTRDALEKGLMEYAEITKAMAKRIYRDLKKDGLIPEGWSRPGPRKNPHL